MGVSDASKAEVALLPVGVDTIALELPQFKRSMEGLGVNLDGDGIDNDEHPLHHLLSKAILTVTNEADQGSESCEILYILFIVQNIRKDYEQCLYLGARSVDDFFFLYFSPPVSTFLYFLISKICYDDAVLFFMGFFFLKNGIKEKELTWKQSPSC